MSYLRCEHVSKWFPGERGSKHVAIQNLSWEIEATEFMVLVGPSGCGKTTVLRMIAGLETPDSGTIFLDGNVLNATPPDRRDIAMVFQTPALFPHLTVEGNIGIGLKLRKVHPAEARERVSTVAITLGLESKLTRFPHELSGGEAQRVALGRALVRQPKVFLLDEPLSNVDPITRKQLRREILCLHEKLQIPMVYVTHDLREAFAMGSRITILHGGEIQQVGTPAEIKSHPANAFVAEFLEDER